MHTVKQPPFKPTFPPRFATPPADAPVLCRARSGVSTVPMLVTLKAFGGPALAVVVNATRQRFAYNVAIYWARSRHYGTKRITELEINHINNGPSDS